VSIITLPKQPAISLNTLEYMVMCYVWEQEKMRVEAIRLMQETIVAWKKWADWSEDLDLIYVLQRLAAIIKWADEGKYDKRKALFKEKNINWRKVYDVPGARTYEDIAKAQETYEQYKRENPEQESA
jgi:hypothetical protein